MKRLLNAPPSADRSMARLRAALATVRPLDDRDDARRRVRARMRIGRAPVDLRLKLVVGLAIAGLAVAAIFIAWPRHHRPSHITAPVVPIAAPRSPVAAPPPTPASPQGPPGVAPAIAPSRPPPPHRAAAPSIPHPAGRDPAANAREKHAEPLETMVVIDAINALRRDRDPARAGMLLEFYLRRYPDGALSEEALALSIEAAVDRDDGSAAGTAESYLQRYPAGRYAPLARGALHR